MLQRRTLLAGLTGAALAPTAYAQSWKGQYPELVYAVVPAENASGVVDRFTPFASYLTQQLGTKVTLRVANNIDPERDIQFTLGPVDSLDHASRLPNFGSKMGIDATRKWAAEGFTRPWPAMLEMPDEVKRRVAKICKDLGLE